jgi:hypothetical protein
MHSYQNAETIVTSSNCDNYREHINHSGINRNRVTTEANFRALWNVETFDCEFRMPGYKLCALRYGLQLYNIVILLLASRMPRYKLCTAVQTAAVQYCYIIISIQNAKVQTVCTVVWTAAVQYCYIIISIQNAKVQTVCTAVWTLLLLAFRMPRYKLCYILV